MASHSQRLTSSEYKAELFYQLYQLEHAGLSLQENVDLLKQKQKSIDTALNRFKTYLAQGRTISDSGYKAKLFSDIDRSCIEAGELSGQLSNIYQGIANHYSNLVKRQKHIKSKLRLPAAMIILMLFIQPLPDFIVGHLSVHDYLSQSLWVLVLLTGCIYLTINMPKYLRAFGLSAFIDRLQLNIPIYSPWLIKRQINQFFQYLSLLLQSGLTISPALSQASSTIKNMVIRKQFIISIEAIEAGNTLTDVWRDNRYIDKTTLHLINTAEQSGRLAESIKQFSSLKADQINSEDGFITDWIPRIIYLVVIVVIAYSIVTSSSIVSVPIEL